MASGTCAELSRLPIEERLPAIVAALPPGATVLLQAPPGAGKTTRVPLALLEAQTGPGTILMIEPRRLAARAAAERMAAGLGEPVGQGVGYSVRLERKVSAATRLEVVTGGIFLRRIQADPTLEGVGCVIFDEFHERHADADLALALVRQARSLLRPDLRLLIMSATLDLAPLAERLDQARVITSEGRSHPVEIQHQAPRPGEPLEQQVLRALECHWLEHRQDHETVLIFLPGQREINSTLRSLVSTEWGAKLECCPLHGQLPLAAQRRAIAAARHPEGKLVLASSIAESSLTIEGVRLVIDSGLSRISRFDPVTGMDGLVTVAASQASAEQRRGRAGRLSSGRCLRLWSAAEQQRRPAFDSPELLETDPLPLALQLAEWGSGLGEDLPWIDPPPHGPLSEARELLKQLGILSSSGQITSHGRAVNQLGLHPRLGHMLLQAAENGWLDLGCSLAVLLNERDPLDRREAGCDLMRRLDWLRQPGAEARQGQQRPWHQLERQLRRQLQQAAGDSAAPSSGIREQEIAARLISWAYPERLALSRGRGDGRFLMRNGRGACVHREDPHAGAEGLAIASVDGVGQEARVMLAVPLSRGQLEELALPQAVTRNQVSWDGEAERVRCEQILHLDALVLETKPWPAAEPGQMATALLEGIRSLGMDALPWSDRSRQLAHRLSLAHRHLGAPWPDRCPEALLADLPRWLGPHLPGLRSRQDLQQLDLWEALWGELEWNRRQMLENLLPEQLPIPSGRSVTLDYASGEPVLAVKLQELFGWAETPRLLEGRLPITVQMLSPAGRPAAITRDLAGFWEGGYTEVRKELRGRYPKHPWPEDPARATPTALTKARLARQGQTPPPN
jgi:ATP-dependent helicase HrpB